MAIYLSSIPISVWAQLETFHATLRLRLQLTESPPYIGKVSVPKSSK